MNTLYPYYPSTKSAPQSSRKLGLFRAVLLLLLWLPALAASAQVPLFQLDIQAASSTLTDPTYVYVQDGATTDFESAYDAEKLSNSSGLNLATITPSGQRLAINAVPPEAFDAPLTIGLFVGIPQQDQYTLVVTQLANFSFSNVYLVDDVQQTRQLLALGTTYSFLLGPGNTNNTYTTTRFSLVFEEAAAPLPVTLVAFTAQRQGADGWLRWSTASELRNSYFQVESSTDGTKFTPLGRVAGAGTSAQAHTYEFRDANLARYAGPQVYYRLRQVDTDGTSVYSPVRTVAVPPASSLLVQAFPNPSGPAAEVALTVGTDQAGPATWWLTDMLGRPIGQPQQLAIPAGTTTLSLPGGANLATGLYLLHVQQGTHHQAVKLVRQ